MCAPRVLSSMHNDWLWGSGHNPSPAMIFAMIIMFAGASIRVALASDQDLVVLLQHSRACCCDAPFSVLGFPGRTMDTMNWFHAAACTPAVAKQTAAAVPACYRHAPVP